AKRARPSQNWKLEIEYDGTRYSGWQVQPHARTVQGELIKAAESFLKTKAEIGGSGRTDAGVHALRQVAHLNTGANTAAHTARGLQVGLNTLLPHDINILKIEHAHARFHARHDAVARYYLYQISTRRTAFGKPYVWWVRDRLDVALMTAACASLLGRHDFRSFCERRADQDSTVVEVAEARLSASDDLILIRIGASHFLWKMVRRIVGALVQMGRGDLTPADFRALLETYNNAPAAWTAPPSGLFLEQVLYPGDSPPQTLRPAFAVR
ncbi:MAG: tRNA pseudouridine(38-40) synthase TruA, partial [Pyrinomonadaceae bacterium]